MSLVERIKITIQNSRITTQKDEQSTSLHSRKEKKIAFGAREKERKNRMNRKNEFGFVCNYYCF